MKGAEDNKWAMGFVAIAIVAFLLITSPGWKQVLGIEGMEQQALIGIILVLVVGGMYWVTRSSGEK